MRKRKLGFVLFLFLSLFGTTYAGLWAAGENGASFLEAEEFANRFKQVDKEAALFTESIALPQQENTDLPDQPDICTLQKCQSSSPCSAIFPPQTTTHLLLFISASLPEESWRDFSASLEKLGGSFVLRSMPGGSFQSWALFVKGLKEKGINAPILIDPEAFSRYNIQAVPTLLLDDETHFDTSVGNVPLLYSLTRFAETGETRELAKNLLIQLYETGGKKKR